MKIFLGSKYPKNINSILKKTSLVTSKKQNHLPLANAEELVYNFHHLWAIRKLEIVDLNARYVADVEEATMSASSFKMK